VREGIIALLNDVEELEVCGTASNGYEVLELAERSPFDVCLLDINMPLMDGMETARVLRERKPGLKIIMLTTYNDREIISEMIHIGVSGYLLKNSDKKELVESIRKVMAGRYYFSLEVEQIILEGLTEKKSATTVNLTDRELQVVKLLAMEYTNERISRELNISFRTVETHRKNIMQKTHAQNLAGLIRYAFARGIIK
jgi:DNA-binding NarL/FixJ family response regulator